MCSLGCGFVSSPAKQGSLPISEANSAKTLLLRKITGVHKATAPFSSQIRQKNGRVACYDRCNTSGSLSNLRTVATQRWTKRRFLPLRGGLAQSSITQRSRRERLSPGKSGSPVLLRPLVQHRNGCLFLNRPGRCFADNVLGGSFWIAPGPEKTNARDESRPEITWWLSINPLTGGGKIGGGPLLSQVLNHRPRSFLKPVSQGEFQGTTWIALGPLIAERCQGLVPLLDVQNLCGGAHRGSQLRLPGLNLFQTDQLRRICRT